MTTYVSDEIKDVEYLLSSDDQKTLVLKKENNERVKVPLNNSRAGINSSIGSLPRGKTVLSGSYESLSAWRAGLKKVRAGLGNARVLAIGDSTLGGTPTSCVDRAADIWAANRLKEAHTGLIYPGDLGRYVDPRVVYAGGAANGGADTYGLAQAGVAIINPGGAGQLNIGPVYCDTWELWTFDAGAGTFDVWSDSGSHTTVTNTGTAWYKSTVISAGALGNHTLHIGAVTGTLLLILAAEGRVGSAGLYVSRSGIGASYSSLWNSTAGGGGSPLVIIGPMIAPDLTILMLVTGDANTQESLEDYHTNIDAIVVQQKTYGSVLLAMPPRPVLPDVYPIKYDDYVEVAESIRDARDTAMINYAIHFDSLAHDDYMGDALHPTVDAQGEMAMILADALIP